MTNPTSAIRMLITYVICIPIALIVGYLITDPMDYSTLGFLAAIFTLLLSPFFIKWNYTILIFSLACPATCFFLFSKPPLGQVVVVLSLLVAVSGGIISTQKRFLRVPVMIWPMLFIAGVVYMTARLNGGISFHSAGDAGGGGKKYIQVLIGIATYFAVTSQVVPPEKRSFYLKLFYLTPMVGVIGDLAYFLPGPLRVVNLMFPSHLNLEEGVVIGTSRLGALAGMGSTLISFLLVRYGLRGILSVQHLWRPLLFAFSMVAILLGGYRNGFAGMAVTLVLIFFLSGLHRSRLVPALMLIGVLLVTVLATCSNKLPYTIQRSMCFLPLKWDSAVVLEAQGSSEWRYQIWRATWPTVPQYLLLGRGFNIPQDDFESMGGGTFANARVVDPGQNPLAMSNDFHSGPLSTLVPFGIWGGIGIVWLMGAGLFVTYRNFRYGEPDLYHFNVYMFAGFIYGIFGFFFVFGGFNAAVGDFGCMAGWSIAMNGRVGRPEPKLAVNPRIKPLPVAPMPIANRPIPI